MGLYSSISDFREKIEEIHLRSYTEALEFAICFDNKYPEIKIPHIGCSSDEEISLWWDMGKSCRLFLGFFGDGVYNYYGRTDMEEFFGDDIPVDIIKLPKQIIDKL